MINAIYYKNDIIKVGVQNLAFINNQICKCLPTYDNCVKCLFSKSNKSCYKAVTEWLYEDCAIPRYKLTKSEKIICQALRYGYLFRNSVGVLVFTENKPYKEAVGGIFHEEFRYNAYSAVLINTSEYVNFNFIEVNEKAWAISELLTLPISNEEVIE